jgi:hypothetical protein
VEVFAPVALIGQLPRREPAAHAGERRDEPVEWQRDRRGLARRRLCPLAPSRRAGRYEPRPGAGPAPAVPEPVAPIQSPGSPSGPASPAGTAWPAASTRGNWHGVVRRDRSDRGLQLDGRVRGKRSVYATSAVRSLRRPALVASRAQRPAPARSRPRGDRDIPANRRGVRATPAGVQLDRRARGTAGAAAGVRAPASGSAAPGRGARGTQVGRRNRGPAASGSAGAHGTAPALTKRSLPTPFCSSNQVAGSADLFSG